MHIITFRVFCRLREIKTNNKMGKRLRLLSTIVLIQSYTKTAAQDVIFNIPIVGDTIDYEEKVKFVLFEEIPNNDYFFSIISERNSDTLITHYKKIDTIEKKVSQQYILSILSNINKLNTYYNSIGNQKYAPQDYSKISDPNRNPNYSLEERRLDSLLTTNPKSYKEIKKKEKKTKKSSSYTMPTDGRTDKEIWLQRQGIGR